MFSKRYFFKRGSAFFYILKLGRHQKQFDLKRYTVYLIISSKKELNSKTGN